MHTAVVLGAGPAGLACARALQDNGADVVVLERGRVGASWRAGYDRLTLNTDRRLSSLPGRVLPPGGSRWISRDAFVGYLQDYAEGLDVRTGAEVTAVRPAAAGWRVRTAAGGTFRAEHVVIATGPNRVPHLPAWPGALSIPLLHSAAYRNAEPYRGRHVLVVGAGNSGSEIAAELSEVAQVTLSVRTAPALFPRAIGPVPTQLGAFALPFVPSRVGDAVLATTLTLLRRNDAAVGLAAPRRAVTDARRGQIPVLDAGLRAAVHAGRVTVAAAVERLDGGSVVLADGSAVRPDAVIAATGWRPGLEALLGHLGVLDTKGLPTGELPSGLHAVGFGRPLTGYLHAAGFEAASVAARITGGGRRQAAITGLLRRLPLPA